MVPCWKVKRQVFQLLKKKLKATRWWAGLLSTQACMANSSLQTLTMITTRPTLTWSINTWITALTQASTSTPSATLTNSTIAAIPPQEQPPSATALWCKLKAPKWPTIRGSLVGWSCRASMRRGRVRCLLGRTCMCTPWQLKGCSRWGQERAVRGKKAQGIRRISLAMTSNSKSTWSPRITVATFLLSN